MTSQSSILRTSRRFALAGLAAAIAVIAVPGSALAQRATTGDVWAKTLDHGEVRLGEPRLDCSPTDLSSRASIGGRYEIRYERIWVPATTRREWVPARYGYSFLPCGLRVRHVIRRGHYRTFRVPGYHDHRAVKVWIPARRSIQSLDRYGERRTHRVSHIGRRR